MTSITNPLGCHGNQKAAVSIQSCRVGPELVNVDATAGGRRKPVPKVTIMDLNRRMTGEAKDFQEVMEQARRVSQGGEA